MSPAPHPTMAQLLDERAGALVGRVRELAALDALVERDRPLVAYVHGVAGTGKTTLLRAFSGRARSAGAVVIKIDGGGVEPTERGLDEALGTMLGRAGGDAAGHLAALGDRVVLVVDGAERLRLIDDWLRQAFIPSLAQHVRVVLAGRERPHHAWTATYGELLMDLPLGNLRDDAAAELLARLGVARTDAERVNLVAHGHPLSLCLAASALASRPELPLEQVATSAVVDELARLYLAGLDPSTRRALDAAALVRRPTRSVLRAMLPDVDDDETFTRLEALPFAGLDADGIVLHDTVRDAVDAMLRASDPERRRALRAAAYRHLRSELRTARSGDLWRSTADMIHLIDNPLIRDGFFPPAGQHCAIEPAATRDRPAIIAIAERHEPREAAELLAAWLDAAPDAFRVARDRHGDVVGVIGLAEPGAVPIGLLRDDPLAALWREDLRRRPMRREDRAMLVRWLLTRDDGEGPGPVQAALWLDAKRAYMALRPHLRRMYTLFRRPERFVHLLEPLGFVPVAGTPTEVGGVDYHSLSLDFGPRSVDGWIARLVAGELELDDEPLLDAASRQLVLGEQRIPLTELELALLDYLREREGQTVSRADLLRDVWKDDWQRGSNVIDVAVSALRRKLGDRASLIETVRGAGYRMRAP